MNPVIRKTLLAIIAVFAGAAWSVKAADPTPIAPHLRNYNAAAHDVMNHIQEVFYLPKDGLYARSLSDRHPDFMWGNGIMFSALLGAARNDPQTYAPLVPRFFQAMNRYWDTKAPIPSYEPAPTNGNGHDKYYDDNAWMVLACLEAYDMTHDPRYSSRAQQTLTFVLSGWDDTLGGGIWWHEKHKSDSKNTCANAPAAVGCLWMAAYLPPEKAKASIDMARKIVDWTETTFEEKDGLYADSVSAATGKMNRDRLTYNTALMIRAFLGLANALHDTTYLEKADRAAAASDWFLDPHTHAYRDPAKWSHLLVEADLEMYRATKQEYLLKRAMDNADYEYAMWKQHPSDELIDNASVARTLWLMADVQSETGRAFWVHVDHPSSTQP